MRLAAGIVALAYLGALLTAAHVTISQIIIDLTDQWTAS